MTRLQISVRSVGMVKQAERAPVSMTSTSSAPFPSWLDAGDLSTMFPHHPSHASCTVPARSEATCLRARALLVAGGAPACYIVGPSSLTSWVGTGKSGAGREL